MENNLAQERQNNHNLRQQLRNERETNANLTQKLHQSEQNYSNLQAACQNVIKAKQTTEILLESEKQKTDHYETQLKSITKALHQWRKINYYQQLEQGKTQMEAKIFHSPPWKSK